jgi:hypothetical protein
VAARRRYHRTATLRAATARFCECQTAIQEEMEETNGDEDRKECSMRSPSSRSIIGQFWNDKQRSTLVRHNKLKTSSQTSTFADSASPEGDTEPTGFFQVTT